MRSGALASRFSSVRPRQRVLVCSTSHHQSSHAVTSLSILPPSSNLTNERPGNSSAADMNEPASSGIVKKLLDPMARENPANHDLKQHFQEGYDLLTPTFADTLREQEKTGSARSVAPGFAGRMYARLILLWNRFGISCTSSSPSSTHLPYALAVLSHIL